MKIYIKFYKIKYSVKVLVLQSINCGNIYQVFIYHKEFP